MKHSTLPVMKGEWKSLQDLKRRANCQTKLIGFQKELSSLFMERKRNRTHLRFGVFFFFIFSNFTIFSSAITGQDTKRCSMLPDVDFQKKSEEKLGEISLSRRFLGGPGSSPPRCSSKCGKCTPCRAVHVPVPPGTPVTAEYYPEAWRCKCGNKLYMP
ncbi:EPIDERMAL PATTERNING FACTOR-like protein 6 isoform X3 [Prosopis cineraria]|uniref:EPIDERMAL PATTERNING FACTOR-like protein 6 isoform X3 n=1 Tax=Prosopis cineraria TaxID=364024 RepID=UPI00240F4294|nr:EPIDERMAL PATTERNING FACTOR-like protein 6 isoform X3 [Prosopis cineraria]